MRSRNLINALEPHLPPRKRILGIPNELKVNKTCIALQGGPPFGHEPLTALEQWKAFRHWPLCKWLVSNRYMVNRDSLTLQYSLKRIITLLSIQIKFKLEFKLTLT